MGHITYKKLWKLMIDRELLKKDLREGAKLSDASMAKLSKIGTSVQKSLRVSVIFCAVKYPIFAI